LSTAGVLGVGFAFSLVVVVGAVVATLIAVLCVAVLGSC
jgi:hypothetical protein